MIIHHNLLTYCVSFLFAVSDKPSVSISAKHDNFPTFPLRFFMWKLKMKLQAGGWKRVERKQNQSANHTEKSLPCIAFILIKLQLISFALSGICQLANEDKRSNFNFFFFLMSYQLFKTYAVKLMCFLLFLPVKCFLHTDSTKMLSKFINL